MEVLEVNVTLISIFGYAPFFVSPARHGEAQDMSGDLQQKKQNKKTHTRASIRRATNKN
jgi:hypothetical protein